LAEEAQSRLMKSTSVHELVSRMYTLTDDDRIYLENQIGIRELVQRKLISRRRDTISLTTSTGEALSIKLVSLSELKFLINNKPWIFDPFQSAELNIKSISRTLKGAHDAGYNYHGHHFLSPFFAAPLAEAQADPGTVAAGTAYTIIGLITAGACAIQNWYYSSGDAYDSLMSGGACTLTGALWPIAAVVILGKHLVSSADAASPKTLSGQPLTVTDFSCPESRAGEIELIFSNKSKLEISSSKIESKSTGGSLNRTFDSTPSGGIEARDENGKGLPTDAMDRFGFNLIRALPSICPHPAAKAVFRAALARFNEAKTVEGNEPSVTK
jgi:hypothetical protein